MHPCHTDCYQNQQELSPIHSFISKSIVSLKFIIIQLLTDNETDLQMQILEQIITLLKIARQNKMLVIDDDEKIIKLEKKCQMSLHQLRPDLTEFKLHQDILMKLVLSENFRICLDCVEIVAMEQKASSSISKFEYEMMRKFIKYCLRTTFPEFRQKFIKAVKLFIIRLRTVSDKDIRKFIQTKEKSENLKEVMEFIEDILNFIYENLYLDKPVEGALPYFEIFKIIIDLFGDFEYKLRISQVFPPCYLLTSANLLNNDSFFIFLLNSLKSTWTQVRVMSYQILTRYPTNYPLFNNPEFVNGVLLKTAQDLCNNPKAMMAEASAFFHNLIFNKCLKEIAFIKPSEDKRDLELQFLRNILDTIKSRVSTFQVSLIKEGKKEALLHGLLSFFKHLFEEYTLKIDADKEREKFLEWRVFFKDLMATILHINQVCKRLISNNGLMSEDDALGDIQVDCRGHPIKMDGLGEGGDVIDDYENFILVGVWLAVKENGITLFNLLKWIEFPTKRDDDNKFVQDQDIEQLSENFLDMLFNFKHRGAIEKAAESFSLFSQKLLESPEPYYKSIPDKMLDQALEKITTENLSTILRRSAGIPPTIIAILRAEPISSEPLLLNKSLKFLLDLAKTADKDDSKIHALNIMRFIFQDALLRHDIQSFITPAMILATDSFSSNNWSIRNSALMAFTALTKRLLNNLHVQDQDLSRTKGLSVWDFLTKFHVLSDFFISKLVELSAQQTLKSKEDKEKQDLVVFSILLLLSRLIPSFQLVEFNDKEEIKSEESKTVEQQEEQKLQLKNREESILNYVTMIKQYSSNPTYFVRKISAQALLPFIKFEDFILEIENTCEEIFEGVSKKNLRQNQMHGLIVRVNVFVKAYFQYRDINNKQLGPGHYSNIQDQRKSEEERLIKLFEKVESVFKEFQTKYSKVSLGLLIKTHGKIIQNINHQEVIQSTYKNYNDIFQEFQTQKASTTENKSERISADEQILLKEVLSILLILNMKLISVNQSHEKQIQHIFSFMVDEFTDNNCDFVYNFLLKFKSLTSRLIASNELALSMSDYLSNKVLPQILQKDEKYCKVIEQLLQVTYRFLKQTSLESPSITQTFFDIQNKFTTNPSIVSQTIKLLTLQLRDRLQKGNCDLINEISSIIEQYSYMDQKEQVRIASSKALGKLLPTLKLIPDSVFLRDEQSFRGYLSLFYSMIILLNDEQPDIRYYLCDNGLTDLLTYSVPNWRVNQHIQVQINDAHIQELLFQEISDAVLDSGKESLITIYTNEFLIGKWIKGNPYREHNEKNFEDKIFFFEPINKFYDLPWIKRLAFEQLLQKFTNYIKVDSFNQEIGQNLKNYYSQDQILSQSSLKMEKLSQNIMLSILAKNDQIKETIQNQVNTENYVKSLIK